MSDTAETQTLQNEPMPQNVEVPVNLLVNLKNIMSIITSRGAFRVDELKVVGNLYEQLCNSIPKETQKTI